MKLKLILILLVFLVSVVTIVKSGNFSSASTEFATKLYRRTAEGHQKRTNIVMSPLSIQNALSVMLFGAYGQTNLEMRYSLNYNDIELDQNQMIEKFKKLKESLANIENLKSLNKLFVQNSYKINPLFQKVAEESFATTSEHVNFLDSIEAAKTINDWVESSTENKIKGLIDPDSLDDETILLLANAVFFRGIWKNEFDPKLTELNAFYDNEKEIGEVFYMKANRLVNYKKLKNLNSSAIELEFNKNNISMIILLPDTDSGFNDLEENINEVDFNKLQDEMFEKEMNIEIPKFKFEYQVELEKALSKIGMGRMFTNSAEFKDILETTEQIKISQAVHKAFIEIDEFGVEAAAATAIQTVSIVDELFYVKLNKFNLLFLRFFYLHHMVQLTS